MRTGSEVPSSAIYEGEDAGVPVPGKLKPKAKTKQSQRVAGGPLIVSSKPVKEQSLAEKAKVQISEQRRDSAAS